jgi:acyl-coenzyme A thioesterase 13
MANFHNSIHGGCTATVIDILSSMLVIGASQPGMFQVGGVSRNLNVTYLRPMRVGSEVRVICELVQMGKRLALLRTEIRGVETNELCALGDHQKANTDAKPMGRI